MSRVNVMHPNGEILLSYPPNHFDSRLVRRMRAGQVRARLAAVEGGGTELRLEDEGGTGLHSEKADPASAAVPGDVGER